MNAADDQSPYDFITWTGTTLHLHVWLGDATTYEPEIIQLPNHIIHKGISSGPVHKYGPRVYIC